MLRKLNEIFFFFKFHYRRKTFADDEIYDDTILLSLRSNISKIFSFRFVFSFQKSSSAKILESLQWIGETGLREAAEGRVVTAKLVCRDASQKSKLPGVFTPCVAFRVAGSQSKSSRYSSSLLNRFSPPLE